MAGEQSTAVETKTCTRCGESKALDLFRPGKNQCRECYRTIRRERYASSDAEREKARQYAREQRERLRADPNGRAVRRQWKRNVVARYRAAGLTNQGKPRAIRASSWIRGAVPDAHWDRLAEANALQAWRWWMKAKAPLGWRRAYHEAAGLAPWLRPGLGSAERLVIRYAYDATFREREYARLQTKKRRDRMLLAQAMLLPGALTAAETEGIRVSAAPCFYCGRERVGWQRTVDHRVPLSKGGRHDRANVVPCCRSCNSAKQDRIA